jgi:hypothetical protein
MRIESRVNQYQGINAHYQSHAQNTENGWKSFHSSHIIHLGERIQDALPPGYQVAPEESLQVRLIDPGSGTEVERRTPEPDITIFYRGEAIPASATSAAGVRLQTPVATSTAIKRLAPDEELTALVIYHVAEHREPVPVVRIEVLSPTNKSGHARDVYTAKRFLTLDAGTVLVELDYLHQTGTLLAYLSDEFADYAAHQPGAYPYTILVTDPRPIADGQMAVYGFAVDEPQDHIQIPLLAGESVAVDFLGGYRHTFERFPWYSSAVDYAREPRAFHTYHPADQGRIWARMLAVIDAVRTGQDLDDGPFPIRSDDPTLQALMRAGYQAAALLVADDLSRMGWLLLRGEGEAARLEWWERGHLAGEIIQHGDLRTLEERLAGLQRLYDAEGFAALVAAVGR